MNWALIVHGAKPQAIVFANQFQAILETKKLPKAKLFITTQHNDAKNCVAEAARFAPDVLIVIGGDGTLNQVVDALLKNFPNALPFIYLVPLGTGNDFARYLKTTIVPAKVFEQIMASKTVGVDVGDIRMQDASGKPVQHYFINVADAGIGAEVARRVNQSKKPLGSHIAFMWSALLAFSRFKKQEVTLTIDGIQLKKKCLLVVVANNESFGSAIYIAPGANPTDGIFDVTIIGDVGVWHYLKFLPRLKAGKRIAHKEVSYLKANTVSIETAESPAYFIDTDGDVFGCCPAEFTLKSQAIRFVVP